MRYIVLLPCALIWVAGVTSFGCGQKDVTGAPPPRTDPAPTPNFILLQSETGDYVGAGLNATYTQLNAVLEITASGRNLAVNVTGDQRWSSEFQVPASISQLQRGRYADL